jgi:hypothetical protein
LLRGLTRTLESRGEKGVGSVRLRIVEGYVFYPSTQIQLQAASEGSSLPFLGYWLTRDVV